MTGAARGPRVAVAMPVYNDERRLPLALEALSRQQFTDFHLTVFDDGSTDRSAELAESFSALLPLAVIRSPHLGLQAAKKRAAELAAPAAPYLLALDADIALPPESLGRMVALLDANERAASVSALARSTAPGLWGAAQAFLDDLFARSVQAGAGETRWIVGGCSLYRRSALAEAVMRTDVNEDAALSEQLRARWRFLLPAELIAAHHGVPRDVRGVLRRFFREGARVRALHRAYPSAWSMGSLARLVPLALLVLLAVGVLSGSAPVALAAAGLLGAHALFFLAVSARVAATFPARLAAVFLFSVGNAAYGAGYLRESLLGGGPTLRDPSRAD